MHIFSAALAVALHATLVFCYDDYSVRIEAEVIRLENPQGLTASGQACGGPFASRQCDTIIAAKIDR